MALVPRPHNAAGSRIKKRRNGSAIIPWRGYFKIERVFRPIIEAARESLQKKAEEKKINIKKHRGFVCAHIIVRLARSIGLKLQPDRPPWHENCPSPPCDFPPLFFFFFYFPFFCLSARWRIVLRSLCRCVPEDFNIGFLFTNHQMNENSFWKIL